MIRRLAASIVVVGSLACGPALEPADRPVLNIDGTRLTRGELDAYLAINLAAVEDPQDDGDEMAGQGELVRSRLLDTWIDEQLVVSQAAERGLTIDDEQLDEQLDDPAYESGEGDRASQRAYLRNRLLIELVQSQVLHDIASPSSEETVAWLDANPDFSISDRRVHLRSLRFDSAEDAQRVHRSLRGNRLTFNEAVLQNSDDESQGASTIVDWPTLPPEVRQALEKLRRGWSSVPVDLGGSTYLFQVVEWVEPDPDAQIEAARAEIISAARRAAWREFVSTLRASADIRIVHKNLPFRYVSDGPMAGSPPAE